MADQEQIDRIERKLDEVLAFRDVLLKMAMPKLPPAMRQKAAELIAAKRLS